jgi:hypothetical protein
MGIMARNWKLTASLLGVFVLVSGCATSRQQAADLRAPAAPHLAWSRPIDAAKNRAQTVAQRKDLVIPEYRFLSHSAELSLEGEDQLQRVASVLRESPHQLVIESSGPTAALRVVSQRSPEESGKLDRERRQYVVQKLLSLGIPDAEMRVVLESPDTGAATTKF